MWNKFATSGSVIREQCVVDEGTDAVSGEEAVLQAAEDDPRAGTRSIGSDLGIDNRRVRRILQKEALHSYKFTPIPELLPQDK